MRRRRRSFDAARVTRGLWVGSAPSAPQAEELVRRGITAVVDLRAERSETASWPPAVVVDHIPLVDHAAPTADELDLASRRVSELVRGGHEVLVHCRAGLERAPTIACAVLMRQGWSLADAYRRVVEARHGAAPTEGQLAALRSLGSTGSGDPAKESDPPQ
jgi:protein-tyrosine phosphatase